MRTRLIRTLAALIVGCKRMAWEALGKYIRMLYITPLEARGEEMRMETDILVVGLGAMGSAALYHLARLGATPVGIEQHAVGHALGSSHGQSRVFRTFYHDALYTKLALAALPLWRELEALSGEQLLTLCGNLLFAQEGHPEIAGHIEVMDEVEAAYELLTPTVVRERFPALQLGQNITACYVPQAGFLNPSRSVQVHIAQAQRFGATVHDGVTVLGIDSKGERLHVETSNGGYSCNRAVVTPGPWAAPMLGMLGLSDLAQQLRVTRQQKFYFRPANPAAFGPDALPVYADYDRNFYGFPHSGPGIKVADDNRGEVTSAVAVDRTLDLAKRDELHAWLDSLMPNADFRYVEGSTCMYTETPDRDFLLGPHPTSDNVIIGAGFSGHGFKFATLVGKLLAELTLGEPVSHSLARFRLDRFGV